MQSLSSLVSDLQQLRRSVESDMPAAAGAADEATAGAQGAALELQTPLTQSDLDDTATSPADLEAGGASQEAPPPSAAGDDDAAASPAAAPSPANNLVSEAALQRLTAGLLSLDIRQIMDTVMAAAPFAALLAVVFLARHWKQILYLYGGHVLLGRANRAVRLEVARKGGKRLGTLLVEMLKLTLWLGLLGAMALGRRSLGGILILRAGPNVPEFWDVLFTVAIADIILRLMLAQLKLAVVTILPGAPRQKFRFRGRILTAIEHVGALYRCLVPSRLWVTFFVCAEVWWPLGLMLVIVYTLIKVPCVWTGAWLAAQAVTLPFEAAPGAAPTPEQLAAAPTECVVCQDELRSPLRLPCGHMFCEECISEWLERQATCPTCRAATRSAGLRLANDGSTSMAPILW